MSTFAVPIKRINAIEPHPNADAIELAVIDGYRSIVKKGEFEVGSLIAYIPEDAVLPDWMLKRMGFWDEDKHKGKMHGTHGNRVKAMRLRGELSQGICINLLVDYDGLPRLEIESGLPVIVREGDNVAELLGITKYEPPIPVSMGGEVFNAGQHLTISFDVQNWKSYPDIIAEGEEVIFTEKLHGTFTGITILPKKDRHPEAFGVDNNILIFSKGLGAKGLVFKNTVDNVYTRATKDIVHAIDGCIWDHMDDPIILMGETYGPGVQDLSYGEEVGFRLFAAAQGYRDNQRYLNFEYIVTYALAFKIDTVPVLYKGPFSEDEMRYHTDGQTTMGANHIREGIVMVPWKERTDPRIGRVALKSVSADYLTRKSGTEYN